MADRGARLRGHDEVDPRGIRRCTLGGDDLDRLTVAKRRTQWHQSSIDLGCNAMIADVGVYAVREIHCGGVTRQTPDLAARREDVDLVREQVDLDALHEFFGVAAVLHFHQLLQPLACAVAILASLILATLVLPMCRDARFRHAVHFFRADLHFDRHAVWPEQRGVQRLIAVDAGDRDVILEASRHRTIEAMHQA